LGRLKNSFGDALQSAVKAFDEQALALQKQIDEK